MKLEPELIDSFIKSQGSIKRVAERIENELLAKIRKHENDSKFQELGEKVERLKEEHERKLITSIEFLKRLLELAREAAEAEKKLEIADESETGKAALTKLFETVKNDNTPVIVERIVNDIDGIVKSVRFPGWQNTSEGRKEIRRVLRYVTWAKYKLKDEDLFRKAYEYIEQYY